MIRKTAASSVDGKIAPREPLHKLIDWSTKKEFERRMRRCGNGPSANICVVGVEREEQGDSARAVPGRDGWSDSVAASAAIDRAALSQGRQWPPATGIGEDAAHLFPAAVVQPLGPAGRRRDL